MSTHNIGFYEEISKIITYHQISSNTHLISSAGVCTVCHSVFIFFGHFSLVMTVFLKFSVIAAIFCLQKN